MANIWFISGQHVVNTFFGVSINWGTPKWMVYTGKSNYIKWMINWGTPISRNLHNIVINCTMGIIPDTWGLTEKKGRQQVNSFHQEVPCLKHSKRECNQKANDYEILGRSHDDLRLSCNSEYPCSIMFQGLSMFVIMSLQDGNSQLDSVQRTDLFWIRTVDIPSCERFFGKPNSPT